MTITTSAIAPPTKIDWTKPVLWLFAACLVVLIVTEGNKPVGIVQVHDVLRAGVA